MILVFSLAIAALFASGAFLMLRRDLLRLIAGMVMIGNGANLFIMASALRRGRAAVLPGNGDELADPLVQALVLTAIVISFATAALALVIVYRVYTSHYSVDLVELSAAEEEQSERDEPESGDLVEQEVEEDVEEMPDHNKVEVVT
jgi:multicomponent Na+:H+ antiporter subunit C